MIINWFKYLKEWYDYHTYDKLIKVTDSSVYDLASLTKIVATLPLVMQQAAMRTAQANQWPRVMY